MAERKVFMEDVRTFEVAGDSTDEYFVKFAQAGVTSEIRVPPQPVGWWRDDLMRWQYAVYAVPSLWKRICFRVAFGWRYVPRGTDLDVVE